MNTYICSFCNSYGTRFDCSTWMFACEYHTDIWHKQMMELALVHITDTKRPAEAVCHVDKCDLFGCYVKDGVRSCWNHGENGSIRGLIMSTGDVGKLTLFTCERCGVKCAHWNNRDCECEKIEG